MGHQNFGQILGLIFLSYKILRQCAKESKTATQNIFKAQKNDSDAEQNKTTGMARTTALIFFIELQINNKHHL